MALCASQRSEINWIRHEVWALAKALIRSCCHAWLSRIICIIQLVSYFHYIAYTGCLFSGLKIFIGSTRKLDKPYEHFYSFYCYCSDLDATKLSVSTCRISLGARLKKEINLTLNLTETVVVFGLLSDGLICIFMGKCFKIPQIMKGIAWEIYFRLYFISLTKHTHIIYFA